MKGHGGRTGRPVRYHEVMAHSWMVFVALLALGTAAHAQTPAGDGGESADERRARIARTENRINLRLGMSSADQSQRPTICMEVRLVSHLSLEGCGTGNGLLHHSDGAELAHYRFKWALAKNVLYGGLARAQLGVGFAELQLAADDPGFVIRPDGGVEASGPEAAATFQWLRPMGKGWEFIVNANAGLAWVPGAGDLVVPQNTVQPFFGLEIGAGW